MLNLLGPHAAWLGLVDALGVLAVLGVWFALRDTGERTRLLWSAVGAVLLAVAAVGVFDRVRAQATQLAVIGVRGDGSRRALDVVLLLAGIAAGVFAAVSLRRRAGDAVADTRRQDLLAFAVALALPVSGIVGGGGFGGPEGDVTVWTLVAHFVGAVVVAGAFLVVLRGDRGAGDRTIVAAFALVALGLAVAQAWPRVFDDDRWSTLATGVAAGLVVAVLLPLLASVLPVDRDVAVLAALVSLALLAVFAVATGRMTADFFHQQNGSGGFLDDGSVEGF